MSKASQRPNHRSRTERKTAFAVIIFAAACLFCRIPGATAQVPANLTITSATAPPFQATSTITTSGTVTANGGSAGVTYMSGGTITLFPGFTAYPNFTAMIGTNFGPQYSLTTQALVCSLVNGNVQSCAPGGGTVCPASGSYSPGSVVQLTATPGPGQQFAGWSGGPIGRANPQSFTISGTTTVTASFNSALPPVIASPSSLQVNLSFISFGYYDDNHTASSYGYTTSCPSNGNVSVRSCFKTILGNLRQQGVSGVRIFVPLCEYDTSISPITNCGQQIAPPGQPVNPSAPYFNGSSGPGYTWLSNAARFFADMQGAGIQNVTLTIDHSTLAGSPPNTYGFTLPKAQTRSPSGNFCADTPDTVYFEPSVPYGARDATGQGDLYPLGEGEPDGMGYNCAAQNPYFIGWTNQFKALNQLLSAAQGKVTIYEIDFQQELNIAQFTAEMRFIYDNSRVDTYDGSYSSGPFYDCSADTTLVDNVCILGNLMSSHGFDPSRVTWSAPWVDADTPTDNCADVYGLPARSIDASEIASAVGGAYVGLPDDATVTNGLFCYGTTSNMLKNQKYHLQPDILDVHIYPSVANVGNQDTQVQQVATLDFNDLAQFLTAVNPSAVMMLGETDVGTLFVGATQTDGMQCPSNIEPPNAPASVVAGFNSSSLAGHSVVFRPWMELQNPQGTCFQYPTYQNVNLYWLGPYVPTQY